MPNPTDQELLDGLVSHTLTSLENNAVTTLCGSALYNNPLTKITLPALRTAGTYAFSKAGILSIEETDLPLLETLQQDAFTECASLTSAKINAEILSQRAFSRCTNLEVVDIKTQTQGTNHVGIGTNVFQGSSKLKHLIIRDTNSKAYISNANSLEGTPIATREGAIYVPADLLSAYKTDGIWKLFTLLPIESYPANDFSSITDTWEQILAAEQDGTYKTKYALGDTKKVTIGQNEIYMQIAAFDEGASKITWVSVKCIGKQKMNNSNITSGGYPASAMNAYLEESLFPTIEQTVKEAIVNVEKTSVSYDGGSASTITSNHKLWIPSAREMFGGTSYETSGASYTALFSANTKKIKYNANDQASEWWLRTAYNSTYFRYVNASGNVKENSAANNYGFVIGFCT